MLCVPNNMDIRAVNIESDESQRERKRAIRIYLVMFVGQMLCGLSAFTASCFAIHFHSGGGFPYFIGGFATAVMMIFSSLVAFRIYNKGPYFTSDEQSKKEVLCALNWHRAASFFMFIVCIFGLAIIWMYGLCVEDKTECSYDANLRENKITAIILFSFGAVCLLSSAVGILLVRTFSLAFGLVSLPGRTGVLRYVGYSNDVIEDLRRQNNDMQRQLRNQNSNSTVLPGLQGFTNFGFEPPTPPPYSPGTTQVSLVMNPNSMDTTPTTSDTITAEPPKYGDVIDFTATSLPTDPPPPYSLRADEPNTSSTNTNTVERTGNTKF